LHLLHFVSRLKTKVFSSVNASCAISTRDIAFPLETEMPSQDTIFGEMLFAIGQGAGGASLEEGAAAYLVNHGYAWIVTSQPGRGTPQNSWGTISGGILDRCRDIGALAASLSGTGSISASNMESACLSVEGASDTPWCPYAQT
jgi:hypothetical protein